MAPLDEDWREAVARILKADTGDLRELATIAGADPRTFYVGTRLDGVDVRGQDLRGLNLESIDKSKIKYDEETRFDKAPDRLPLIYLSERDVDHSSVKHLARWTPFIMAEEEADAFTKLAAAHVGPVFILAWGPPSRSALETARELSARGVDYLLVVIDDTRSLNKRDHLTLPLQIEEPWLSVPSNASMLGFRRRAITLESRDAMWVVADRWDERRMFFNGRDAWFARARGVGTEPQRDAAAQILDRIASFSLTTRSSIVVAPIANPYVADFSIDGVAMHLLDGQAAIGVTARRPREDFHLSVFGQLAHRETHDDYVTATFDALRYQTATSTQANGSGAGIETQSGWLKVQSDEGRRFARRGILHSDPYFDFAQVNAIVLSERADISTVVSRLMRDRELWVTSRDLLALPPDGKQIRLLIAAQLRRVTRMMGGRSRRIYLEVVLRQALRDGMFMVDDAGELLDALKRDDFSERHDLMLTKLSVQPYGTTGVLRVVPFGPDQQLMMDARFELRLSIDPDVIEVVGRRPFYL